MDKQGYEQLDRIEQISMENHNNVVSMLNMDATDVLQSFYEKEIQSEKGELYYLHNDEKLGKFILGLNKQQETIPIEEKEERDFGNRPFKQ